MMRCWTWKRADKLLERVDAAKAEERKANREALGTQQVDVGIPIQSNQAIVGSALLRANWEISGTLCEEARLNFWVSVCWIRGVGTDAARSWLGH